MTRNESTSYKPSAMQNYEDSDIFHAKVRRNPETTRREDVMEDFMLFVDNEFEMTKKEKSNLQELVNAFIGYDSKKAELGEREMLASWIQNVKGE